MVLQMLPAWTESCPDGPFSQDVRYMTPIVREVEAENAERAFYDTVQVERK